MLPSSKAKIFLSGNRQLVETDGLKVYNSFAGNNSNTQTDLPAGSLTMLNEILLEAGKSIAILPEENTIVILLAVEGLINYKKPAGDVLLLEAGRVTSFVAENSGPVIIQNPSDDCLARFIQVTIKVNTGFHLHESESLLRLPANKKDELFQLDVSTMAGYENNFKVLMGSFSGRREAIYTPDAGTAIFIFVLSGAFEVQNRLVEAKDGLLLWNVEQVELEALSNDAVILLIGQPMPLL